MTQSPSDLDIKQLSVAERLDLISVLWDSITNSIEELPIPDWHREELERRLISAEADSDGAIPWEEEAQSFLRRSEDSLSGRRGAAVTRP